MINLLLLFLAGGLGTLCRYGLGRLTGTLFRPDLPLATTGVNAIGCLLFGLVVGFAQLERLSVDQARILTIGFLGAFTTFSTFAYEAHQLWGEDRWTGFLVYLAVQNLLGVAFVAVGLRLAGAPLGG